MSVDLNTSRAHSEQRIITLENGGVVPAVLTDYDIDASQLPPGRWRISMFVVHNIGIADCTLRWRAHTARSSVATPNSGFMYIKDAINNAQATTVTLSASDTGTAFYLVPYSIATAQLPRDVDLLNGFQFRVTPGSAGNIGDPLTVVFLCSRVA